VTQDTSHAVAGGDPFGTHMVTDVCIHISEHTNYCELEPEDAATVCCCCYSNMDLGLFTRIV